MRISRGGLGPHQCFRKRGQCPTEGHHLAGIVRIHGQPSFVRFNLTIGSACPAGKIQAGFEVPPSNQLAISSLTPALMVNAPRANQGPLALSESHFLSSVFAADHTTIRKVFSREPVLYERSRLKRGQVKRLSRVRGT